MSSQARESVDDIADSMRYLEKLVAGLRHMAANPNASAPAGGTDVSEWWSEAIGMIRSALPRNVQLLPRIPTSDGASGPPPLPRVNINKIGLTQAVFNLVQNAAEALAVHNSGAITISASACPTDGGASVLLIVSDDGPGMTPEVAARCFEPYFSTKEREVSTGMGLSLVRGIVETAGGTIELQTAPEQGSTFILRLPALHSAVVLALELKSIDSRLVR
jgi:signal transduction histidine kinase